MSLVPFVHIDASLAGAQEGDQVPLTADEVHHLATVLRLDPGDAVEVADGASWWAAGELVGRGVRLQGAATETPAEPPELVVAQALPKGRKLDEVVRQVTELGVDEVLPVVAERCVVRLAGPKADRAVERWEAVARAASEQARRSTRPRVAPIRPLPDLAASLDNDGTVVLVAQPGSSGLPNHLEACRAAARVVVLVGPEGGFTPAELTMLERAGARVAGLGRTTLRTEHAAAAATAVLAAGLGRWG